MRLLHEHESLRVVQATLGHSDLETTLCYTDVVPGWQRAMKTLEREILSPNVPKSENKPEGEIRNLLVRQEVNWRALLYEVVGSGVRNFRPSGS